MEIGRMFYVYEHIRPDTKTVFYVGKGQGNRLNSLKDRNRYWNFIYAKFGSFESRKLLEHDNEELVFLAEQERIDQLRRIGIKLCNVTKGGEGTTGLKHTKTAKQKISEARKKATPFKHTEESKAKIRKANTGAVFTEERKKNISQARKGYKMPESVKLKLKNRVKTYKHSEETLEKMRKIQRAMPKFSCPHCDFVGNAGNVARWHFDNCKHKE
jgi:hypothetical protein